MRIKATRQTAINETTTQHGTCAVLVRDLGEGEAQYILTAKHVVENAEKFEVEDIDGKWVRCALLAKSEDSDLAILVAEKNFLGSFRLAEPERMMALGSSLAEPITTHYSRISGYFLDIPMEHGMSGGPVFNSKGLIAGVMIAIVKSDGKTRGLVLSTYVIDRFLKSIPKPEVAKK
jgi:S1-C subfamily serine protease